MTTTAREAAGPSVVVEVGDRVGPVRIEVRRRGALVAELCVPPAAGDRPGVATDAATDAALAVQVAAALDGAERPPRARAIFDAACEVISSRGLAATSMRDIAQAAGVPIATMYRYIGSKEDLLYRITRDCMQELFDFFETNLTAGGTAAHRLERAIRAYLAYISDNHQYINLVYRETKALSEAQRARVYDVERRFMRLWSDIIEDGIRHGEFAPVDVHLAANLSYFACTAWALRHWAVGDRSEAEVGDALTRLIVGGLRAG